MGIDGRKARRRRLTGQGWRRSGDLTTGFTYLRTNGQPIRSEAALARIRALAIPPAWRDVRISPSARAKVQAHGFDAAGRKQYRYHPEFIRSSAQRKFGRVLSFGRALPALRARTNEHLQGEALSREQVLATVVRLMCRAFFRVGSERYAVANRTFGIATLEKHHLEIRQNDLVFRYSGKQRIDQRRVVAETPLVEIVSRLLDLPGARLFRYRTEEGEVRNVTARDVNQYLREILGERFTSKDIRTWGGTVRAATILADFGPADSARQCERNIALASKLVASELGNTPTICRSAYIHPLVFEHYRTGTTIEPVTRKTPRAVEAHSPVEFYPEEAALLRLLEGSGPAGD